MNKPDPTEVLNENISYLVDIMKLEIDEIGQKHDFTPSQISEMEKDFIARLAFAAIIRDEKEPEKEPETITAKSAEHMLQDICNTHGSCMGCMFARNDTSCRLDGKPYHWEVRP